MAHTDAGEVEQVGTVNKLPPPGRFCKRGHLLGGPTVGTLDLLDLLIFYQAF